MPQSQQFTPNSQKLLGCHLSLQEYRALGPSVARVMDLIDSQSPINGKYQLPPQDQMVAVELDSSFLFLIADPTDEALIYCYRYYHCDFEQWLLPIRSYDAEFVNSFYNDAWPPSNSPLYELASIYAILNEVYQEVAAQELNAAQIRRLFCERGRDKKVYDLPSQEDHFLHFRLECRRYIISIYDCLLRLGDGELTGVFLEMVGNPYRGCLLIEGFPLRGAYARTERLLLKAV